VHRFCLPMFLEHKEIDYFNGKFLESVLFTIKQMNCRFKVIKF